MELKKKNENHPLSDDDINKIVNKLNLALSAIDYNIKLIHSIMSTNRSYKDYNKILLKLNKEDKESDLYKVLCKFDRTLNVLRIYNFNTKTFFNATKI